MSQPCVGSKLFIINLVGIVLTRTQNCSLFIFLNIVDLTDMIESSSKRQMLLCINFTSPGLHW